MPENNNGLFNTMNKMFATLKDNAFQGEGLLNPMQPTTPFTQNTTPRNFQYTDGINLQSYPQNGLRMASNFQSLDFLATNIDLVKIALAYKRLQIGTYKWRITAVDPTDDTDYSKDIDKLTKLFNKPDGKRTFRRWMNKQLYNYFVYDAITIFKDKTRGGELKRLEVIDGKTIKPLVDKNGRIPDAPNPAYQQIIKGVPETAFSTDQLLYYPVNEKIDDFHGCSAVENVHIALNTYARSQNHNLMYFTDGVSTSAGLVSWGEDLAADQLRSVQADFNYFLSNNKNKHRVRFVPKGTNIIRMMEFSFNIEFTEHMIRVICAAFNAPQELFISQINRSTSQTLSSNQENNMLCGELMTFEDIFTDIIHNDYGNDKLQFEFLKDELVEPALLLQQAIQGTKAGIITANEARIKWGYKPRKGGDKLTILTPTGLIPLDQAGQNFNNNQTTDNAAKNINIGDNNKKGVDGG